MFFNEYNKQKPSQTDRQAGRQTDEHKKASKGKGNLVATLVIPVFGEADAGELLRVEGQPWLCREYQGSQCFIMRPFLPIGFHHDSSAHD